MNIRQLIIIFQFFVLLLSASGCKHVPEKIIGIKIYEYDRDFTMLAAQWNKMGINTAFVSKELAANDTFRQILKEHAIRVFVIFPVFQDPAALKLDSSLYAITDKGRIAKDNWVEFACPSRSDFRANKIREAAELARNLHPDGMSIDFIRHFVFWEMIYPERTPESIDMSCFCDSCINDFCRKKGINIPDTCTLTTQKSAYILNFHPKKWNDYRCELITSMVKDLADELRGINPDLKIIVHAVPWRDSDFGGANLKVAGQDLKKITPFADYISPMCYSQMLRRDDAWIESVVHEADGKAPGRILPSIQVYPAYIDNPFTIEDFRRCVSAAVKNPSRGVIFFSWPLFEKDKARMEIINFRKN